MISSLFGLEFPMSSGAQGASRSRAGEDRCVDRLEREVAHSPGARSTAPALEPLGSCARNVHAPVDGSPCSEPSPCIALC